MKKLNKLQTCFADMMGYDDPAQIELARYQGDEIWDSVAHMMLADEIETKFNIVLSANDILGLSSYAAAVAILTKHGKLVDGD